VLALIEELQRGGLAIDHIDLGGGLGIATRPRIVRPRFTISSALCAPHCPRRVTVMIEPGRSIVGQAGVLLTKVLYRKKSPAKEFVIVDAAMNDLIRHRSTKRIMRSCRCGICPRK